MPIAATIQAPTWVNSGATITGGLDLLGLCLPVQFIGGTLLDGVADSGGLLREVEQRYVKNGHKSTFDDVAGDGTLWMVHVATLGNSNWQGGTYIDKAMALREVFTAPPLLASAHPSHIASLLGKIRIDDVRSYPADIAPYLLETVTSGDFACGMT